jgi:hypothetical protein
MGRVPPSGPFENARAKTQPAKYENTPCAEGRVESAGSVPLLHSPREERAVADDKRGAWIAIGLALGAGLGTALGTATDSVGVWLPLGIALGLVFGIVVSRARPPSP